MGFRQIGWLLPLLLLLAIPAQAELIFSEVMPAPNGLEEFGEWFEVYNAGFSPRHLLNFIIRDDHGDSFTITEDIVVPPFSYFVFGASDITTLNGCVPVDYVWSNFHLDNDADEIIIINRVGAAIAQFRYDGSPQWTATPGHAWICVWDRDNLDSNLDCSECWALETGIPYGCCGNFGSPGWYGNVVPGESLTWGSVKALYR